MTSKRPSRTTNTSVTSSWNSPSSFSTPEIRRQPRNNSLRSMERLSKINTSLKGRIKSRNKQMLFVSWWRKPHHQFQKASKLPVRTCLLKRQEKTLKLHSTSKASENIIQNFRIRLLIADTRIERLMHSHWLLSLVTQSALLTESNTVFCFTITWN